MKIINNKKEAIEELKNSMKKKYHYPSVLKVNMVIQSKEDGDQLKMQVFIFLEVELLIQVQY